jgi:cation transporter-like permease
MTYAASSHAFIRAFKETLLGHFGGASGILAGFIVAWQLRLFQQLPWVVAVYPTVLTAMGVISGLFSGRLNTALHIGTVYPRFSENVGTFYKLFQPILAITLITSVAMSAFSMVFGSLLLGLTPANFGEILVVVVATMNLGLILYPFALATTFTVFKKGLDLDGVAYPIITAFADIFITVFYALTLFLFLGSGDIGRYLAFFVAILPAVLFLVMLPRNIHQEKFTKPIKESVLALTLVALTANITGSVLQRIGAAANGRKEILIAYPAMIEVVGDAGLVISSTATTKLALGLLKPSLSEMRNHLAPTFGAWAASASMFTCFSALSLLLAGAFSLCTFSAFACLMLASNVISVLAIVLISYALATLTFQKGLDFDHFIVPTESSLAGVVTSIALLAVLLLMG